jgi:transcriptional regulator with XRE-family HTH domain
MDGRATSVVLPINAGGWQAVQMLDPTPHGDLDRRAIADQAAADEELRALLRQLKDDCGMTYEQLAEAAMLSRGTVQNYVAKPGHGRDTATLKHLLAKLRASEEQRAQALRLHQRTLPAGVDPAAAGWLTRARPAEVTVWSMAQFSATEASVHTAIGRRHRTAHEGEQIGDMATPAYVPRAHDAPLRRDIKQAAVGELQALIVMRGTSSTGKTRSLFEAVHEICPDWMVVRPRSAAAARRLPESRLFDRPCVVWLNELQGFLGPNGYGLSLDVLRDLYAAATAPVVLVGTLWPDKLRDASIARDERTSDTRDLLAGRTPWVRWHEVPRTLTTESERAAARERAVADPRLARAVADHDGFGFAQTLAGAHELLEKYQNAPRPAQLLLDAAAEARRLGHSHALTAPLLRAVSLALWREDHGPTMPPNRWYDDAIAYAAAPVRSDDGVRALIPLDDPDNPEDADEPVGYDLADYLEQHLTRVRRMRRVSDLVWERLRYHTTQPDDLMALAVTAAERYARFDHAEALLRTAASAGAPQALTWLAGWLSDRPAREAEVESTFREAAASGAPGALHGLAGVATAAAEAGGRG